MLLSLSKSSKRKVRLLWFHFVIPKAHMCQSFINCIPKWHGSINNKQYIFYTPRVMHNLQNQNEEHRCFWWLPALLQLLTSPESFVPKEQSEQCRHTCFNKEIKCLNVCLALLAVTPCRKHGHTVESAWEMSTCTPLPCPYLTGYQ